jgi:hypothetical protein
VAAQQYLPGTERAAKSYGELHSRSIRSVVRPSRVGWKFGQASLTTVLSFRNANAGNTSWPNRICNGSLSKPAVSHWFEPGCFAAPAQYQFGNEGRNSLIGPGRNNLDFALHLSFRLPGREGMALEFRAEA